MLNVRIERKAAPAAFPYPVRFVGQEEGDSYLKYGHRVFAGTADRGDPHWTPEIITQTWFQAESGQVPISGAGYGGAFSGEGFEGMWLDMSEIVRPTRDGILGREHISTGVSLGGGVEALEFDEQGRLITRLPPVLELFVPIMLGPLPIELPGGAPVRALTAAAERLGTVAIHTRETMPGAPTGERIGLRLNANDFDAPGLAALAAHSPVYIEIEQEEGDVARCERAREAFPDAIVALRRELGPGSADEVARLVGSGVRVFHLFADLGARDSAGRPLPESLLAVHRLGVEQGWRDTVSLLASGGVAAAEHVPKLIACGADAVVLDLVPQVAWGCALWADHATCRVESDEIDLAWGTQRLVNLLGAWRDQLIEALGAMGMREVRRLRGETGRIVFESVENHSFRALFGQRAPGSTYGRLKEGTGVEGDLRWTHGLLLATREQARLGRPGGEFEFRVGRTQGGFDRLAFPFELDSGWREQLQAGNDGWLADPAGVDLGIELNRRADGRPTIRLPLPWYGAGMSFGSIGLGVMLARARAAAELGTFMSTGEGGYPVEVAQYREHVITQIATGLFGVREETICRARILEIKYAQGAKPGLGGHLLANKNTGEVAREREAVQGTSLYSPCPFHSVYSVEDHKKQVDWLMQVNPDALISVKVSTPSDVDMVAVGTYFAGAHIIHLDGAFGGTGAAPEISKKNIAMPIEYAIPKVHRFLLDEGVRDQVTLMASGGLRSAFDVAKAIALGADGCVIGTAELAALGCARLGRCEQGLGCPFGITTTDRDRSKLIDVDVAARQIVNLYRSWSWQLAGILRALGMRSAGELRGRTDVLVYLEE